MEILKNKIVEPNRLKNTVCGQNAKQSGSTGNKLF